MYFYHFDPLYFLIMLPGIALAAWAQWRVHSAFNWAKDLRPVHDMSGAEAAAVIIKHSGLQGVEIEPAQGFMSDHYDPRAKVLRLSPDVYQGRSLAALGVAAHEAGHALQDAEGYPLLKMRNGLVPLAAAGSNISWILLIVGFFLHSAGWLWAGIIAFSLTVIFQLINLPVEFDASRRAKELLTRIGMVNSEEAPAISRVLNAAAMTYVAGTLMAMLQLAYFVIRSGVLGGNSRDRD